MSTQGADRYLETGGAKLRWRLEGSGPAIALLHGWALDLEYWDPLATLLAPQFTLLRFDRRGFGMSPGVPDINRNVDDLLALLDVAAIGRAALLGMSQGARLAIHFAIAHPERSRALLLDGVPALDAEPDLPLTSYRTLLETAGPAALHAQILRHPLMQLRTREPAIHQLLADTVGHYTGSDLLYPVGRRSTPDVNTIAVPTLIINGSQDSAERRAAGCSLQAAMRNARRVELPDAGHLAMLDDPAPYAQTVSDFCRTLPR
jgi:3-oxoadipate enol-lactonase